MKARPRPRDSDRLRKDEQSPAGKAPGKERIAKVLARAGVASRRDAERMIADGRVALNGAAVTHPATLADASDKLTVDGQAVAAATRSRLWRYHKPAGLVTTARDPEGRPTVFGALPQDLPRVISVGRLDINTEGLLLLTNDGELARFLEHPAQKLARAYRVRAHGYLEAAAIVKLAAGVVLDEVHYRPIKVTVDRRQGGNSWLNMILSEGKNREIKRLLEYFGLQVTRLIRTGYGPFQLGDLPPGDAEEIPSISIKSALPDFRGFSGKRN